MDTLNVVLWILLYLLIATGITALGIAKGMKIPSVQRAMPANAGAMLAKHLMVLSFALGWVFWPYFIWILLRKFNNG